MDNNDPEPITANSCSHSLTSEFLLKLQVFRSGIQPDIINTIKFIFLLKRFTLIFLEAISPRKLPS